MGQLKPILVVNAVVLLVVTLAVAKLIVNSVVKNMTPTLITSLSF